MFVRSCLSRTKNTLSKLTSRHSRPSPWPPTPHRSQWRSSQHSGSACLLLVSFQVLTKKKSRNRVLQGSAVDTHRLPRFPAMIIHRGRLWWWQHVLRPILLRELSNQQEFIADKKIPITGKTNAAQFQVSQRVKQKKQPTIPARFWLESTDEFWGDDTIAPFWMEAGTYVQASLPYQFPPSSNPVDQIRAD